MDRSCAKCGATIADPVQPHQAFCGGLCSRKASRRTRKHQRRVAKGERRAMYAAGDHITIQALGERDGWTCHICDLPTTRRHAGGFDELGPSIDHLVPVVMGGRHTWENVALAHHGCNSRRGAEALVGA